MTADPSPGRHPVPVRSAAGPGAPAVGAGAATGSLEYEILAIWGEVFAVPVDAGQIFFDLGGDSLAAIRITARMRERLGAEVSVPDLFDAPTIAGLAELIRAHAR